jgi:hypothetical protein
LEHACFSFGFTDGGFYLYGTPTASLFPYVNGVGEELNLGGSFAFNALKMPHRLFAMMNL